MSEHSQAETSHTHADKRKRNHNPQDSLDELSKMPAVRNLVHAIRKDLGDFNISPDNMVDIVGHVTELEAVMNKVKKPKIPFSLVTLHQLEMAGIQKRLFSFVDSKINSLIKKLKGDAFAWKQIKDLEIRIEDIHDCVSMEYEPGAPMILDSILLVVRKIAATQRSNLDVAIIPEMKIGKDEGIRICNPENTYELWISGKVDYAILEYEKAQKERILGAPGSDEKIFGIAKGHMFLVEAKRTGLEHQVQIYLPEAICQATALLKSANLQDVRFCVSDGKTWIFLMVKWENDIVTCYEADPYELRKTFDRRRLCNIVQLML